jgi:hypothetical protein
MGVTIQPSYDHTGGWSQLHSHAITQSYSLRVAGSRSQAARVACSQGCRVAGLQFYGRGSELM